MKSLLLAMTVAVLMAGSESSRAQEISTDWDGSAAVPYLEQSNTGGVQNPQGQNPQGQNPQGQNQGAPAPSEPNPHIAELPQAGEPLKNLEDTAEAGGSEAEDPRHDAVRWNEYLGSHFHIRFGGGFLYEVAAFSQDAASKQQFDLVDQGKVRDARILLKGGFPQFKRKITFSAGFMFDAPTSSWLVRETGVMVQVPELGDSYFFFGRTKEGFSLNKVMVGYAGWTIERFTMNDATVPILADGVKWLFYSRKTGIFWNLGTYTDVLSEGQSFSSYEHQSVARVGWIPIHSEEKDKVFEFAANLRYGKVEDGQLQLKSRPEAFPAPFFVDTGTFPAISTKMAGYEVYYRNKGLLLGSEYWAQFVNSPSTGNPTFNGGDVVMAWVLTGESRAFNTVGGFFTAVSPNRPVFSGGPGAWEAVLRFSNIDLDGGTVQGGKFWRFTPNVNWYLSDNVRLSFVYGFGSLNRFGLIGHTQFFQSRIQLQL
jgi:phosphate-selective porin OprO/OprP